MTQWLTLDQETGVIKDFYRDSYPQAFAAISVNREIHCIPTPQSHQLHTPWVRLPIVDQECFICYTHDQIEWRRWHPNKNVVVYYAPQQELWFYGRIAATAHNFYSYLAMWWTPEYKGV